MFSSADGFDKEGDFEIITEPEWLRGTLTTSLGASRCELTLSSSQALLTKVELKSSYSSTVFFISYKNQELVEIFSLWLASRKLLVHIIAPVPEGSIFSGFKVIFPEMDKSIILDTLCLYERVKNKILSH